MKPMRVLLATTQFAPEPGGVPRLLEQFCTHHPPGVEVAVLSVQQQAPEFYRDYDTTARYPIERVHAASGKGATSWLFARRLDARVRRWRPDVVWSGVAYPTAILTAGVAALHRVPFVVYAHSEDVTISGVRKRAALRWALKRARRVAAPSHFTRKMLLDLGLSPARTKVIHPGMDLPVMEATPPPAWLAPLQDKWLLLTVARVVRRKGQDTVLRAMPQLMDTLPDLHYLIAGTGPDEAELQALAHKLGVAEHVTFAGRVSDADLAACYRACRVFVMATRPEEVVMDGEKRFEVEGFGITYLEAAAAGKPAIGSWAGGAAEAIVDGETGLLVEAEDVEALAAAVRRLAQDSGLAQRLGNAGRARVYAHFTADAFAGQITALLEEVC